MMGRMMSQNDDIKQDVENLNQLKETLHRAEKKRTLEEQVAYLRSQGKDPAKSYAKWDDDEEKDDW